MRKAGILTELTLAHHPLDVIGWDGYYYSWAINISVTLHPDGLAHGPQPGRTRHP
ncbi:MAG: hypothetical protein M3Y57_18425 [Acidobacteriota bacterium]|nr:hypothetical protein [Acidobacteriota bacterium]